MHTVDQVFDGYMSLDDEGRKLFDRRLKDHRLFCKRLNRVVKEINQSCKADRLQPAELAAKIKAREK